MRKKSSKQPNNTCTDIAYSTNSKNSTVISNDTAIKASWGARLRNFRVSIAEHRRASNFDAWARSIWQLGSWWLDVAAEEAAGVVYDLGEEFKREQARKRGVLVIPTVCGNILLDKLQAKCLVTENVK